MGDVLPHFLDEVESACRAKFPRLSVLRFGHSTAIAQAL